MNDIGLGLIDKHTTITVIFILVLVNVILGLLLQINTANAGTIATDTIILTGFLFFARTLYRFPVAFVTSFWLFLRMEVRHDRMFNLIEYEHQKVNIFAIIGRYLFLAVKPLIFAPLVSLNFGQWIDDEFWFKTYFKGLPIQGLKIIFGVLDRIGIIGIAVLMAMPGLHESVRLYGIIGISMMVVIFTVRGNFSSIVRDYMEKQNNTPIE